MFRLMLWCFCLEFLNNSLIKGPTFSFHTRSCIFCSQSCGWGTDCLSVFLIGRCKNWGLPRWPSPAIEKWKMDGASLAGAFLLCYMWVWGREINNLNSFPWTNKLIPSPGKSLPEVPSVGLIEAFFQQQQTSRCLPSRDWLNSKSASTKQGRGNSQLTH